MSDNWLIFIPTDPEAQPLNTAADKAVALLKTFASKANGGVSARFAERTEFHSGGAN